MHIVVWKGHGRKSVTLSQEGDQETKAQGWRRESLFLVHHFVTPETTKHVWEGDSVGEAFATQTGGPDFKGHRTHVTPHAVACLGDSCAGAPTLR